MKRILKMIALILSFTVVIFVLVAANEKVVNRVLNPPNIHLTVQNEIILLTKEEVLNELRKADLFQDNMPKGALDASKVESFLRTMNEIESADVYLGLDNNWDIDIKTRRPIARIVIDGTNDFYIDNNYRLMRLSPFSKPHVLAYSGLSHKIKAVGGFEQLINNDSLKTKLKLNQIYHISSYVCSDTFYNAQIVQVQYVENEGFVMIPRVGAQQIILGEISSKKEVEDKFNKLTIFYDEVIPYTGWSQYGTINLKFDNQIVAKKRY